MGRLREYPGEYILALVKRRFAKVMSRFIRWQPTDTTKQVNFERDVEEAERPEIDRYEGRSGDGRHTPRRIMQKLSQTACFVAA